MPLVAISVGTWNNILNSIEHSTQVASQERSRIEDKVIKELHRAINEHAAHPHANGVSRRELDRLEAQLREKIDASTRDR